MESDPQERNSVYDFLYHDEKRIASFLAQFDSSGHLTNLSHQRGITGTSATKSGGQAGVGLPLVASARITANRESGESVSDSITKSYDPLWQNALALLDYLVDRGLLVRNISAAHMGQFVLASGDLFIHDMATVKRLFEAKTIKTMLQRQFASTAKGTSVKDLHLTDIFNALAVYTIHARIVGSGFSVWSTLRPDGLSMEAGDLALKHGFKIAGSWSMVGILDAMPGPTALTEQDRKVLPELIAAIEGMTKTLGQLLGRPPESYGMTPLVVFREISAHAES